MNPTVVRAFSRSAIRRAAAGKKGEHFAGNNWMANLIGVSAVLGGVTAIVAWGNDEKNSPIRHIFRNERSESSAPHN